VDAPGTVSRNVAPARDVAGQSRSPRKAITAEARMTKHLKPKSNVYVGKRKHLRQDLAETTPGGEAIKWVSKKGKGSIPQDHARVRAELLVLFARQLQERTLEKGPSRQERTLDLGKGIQSFPRIRTLRLYEHGVRN
jgi:hypothetical protein